MNQLAINPEASMAKRSTSVNWLREILKDWADWYLGHAQSEVSGDGYSGSTPIWRARNAPSQSPPGSCIPIGVEPPPGLRQICHAMVRLMGDPELGQGIWVMREVYLYGVNNAGPRLKLSQRNVYRLCEQGEVALRAFLRA